MWKKENRFQFPTAFLLIFRLYTLAFGVSDLGVVPWSHTFTWGSSFPFFFFSLLNLWCGWVHTGMWCGPHLPDEKNNRGPLDASNQSLSTCGQVRKGLGHEWKYHQNSSTPTRMGSNPCPNKSQFHITKAKTTLVRFLIFL